VISGTDSGVDGILASAREALSRYQDAMSATTVTGEDPEGRVTARVNGLGTLLGIEFDEDWLQDAGAPLVERCVVEAVAAARQAAALAATRGIPEEGTRD
jgi:DNA-binding protein YbaB